MTEKHRKEYIQAVELAEAGQYEQALQQMQLYLKTHPTDGEALNDTGTILFCMHRGQEAIDYFLRARSCSQGDTLGQVIFNLCEAYLAEDQPDKAVGLLNSMESMEILDVHGVSLLSLRLREGGGVEDYYASRGDTAYLEWAFVQDVLLGTEDDIGDKFAGVAQAPWGDFFYVSGPILDESEELVGIVLVGKSMITLTQEIREATVAQATVYSFAGEPMATTLLEEVAPLGFELVSGVFDRQIEESFLRNLDVANIAYSEILTTMEARGGTDVAIVGTALPQTFLVQPSKVTRVQIFGLATLAFILVIAAGVFVSDRITRPLLQVVQAPRRWQKAISPFRSAPAAMMSWPP